VVVSRDPQQNQYLQQVLYPLLDLPERRIRDDAGATPGLSLPEGSDIILAPVHNKGIILRPDVGHH